MTTQTANALLNFLTLPARSLAATIARHLAHIHEHADPLALRHQNRLGAWETHASLRAAALSEKTRRQLMSENG